MKVGVLGGGQLGRMLALAGYPLAFQFRFLDSSPEAPAEPLAEFLDGDFHDPAVLARFAEGLDLVTYEFENVPVAATTALAARLPVFPPPLALEEAQDRLREKSLFQSLGIPTPPFRAVESAHDLTAAVEEIGLPAVLKTRRLGYDGKGQQVLRDPHDVAAAGAQLGASTGQHGTTDAGSFPQSDHSASRGRKPSVSEPSSAPTTTTLDTGRDKRTDSSAPEQTPGPYAPGSPRNRHPSIDPAVSKPTSAPSSTLRILEGFVRFDREVSLLAVRDRRGAVACYPLVENHHREGILRMSLAPAPRTPPELQRLAEDYARRVLERLDYVGVLAIEFFEKDGQLLANEMAPRVHNSGHWTIEGAATSQFENHLRAVTGLPIGPTAALGRFAMFNLIGEAPAAEAVLALPEAHLHLYGKQPRPGRKLGHVTLRVGEPARVDDIVRRLDAILGFSECLGLDLSRIHAWGE